jgi:hypothetical protein
MCLRSSLSKQRVKTSDSRQGTSETHLYAKGWRDGGDNA